MTIAICNTTIEKNLTNLNCFRINMAAILVQQKGFGSSICCFFGKWAFWANVGSIEKRLEIKDV